MLLMRELTHGELKDLADFRPSFLPFGKAGGRRIPRWKGFAVDYYGGTLSALTPAPSDFCNDGVKSVVQPKHEDFKSTPGGRMILVLYEMEVLAEKQKEFSQAVPLILKATPEQSGCLRHRLCRDVEDDNHLIILQAWKDQSSLDAHWRSESFGAFLGAFHLLRSKPLIQVHAVSYTAGEEVIKAVRAKVMSLDEVIIEK